MKNIPEIESRLTGARTNLTAALERGADTTPFRSAVADIERELDAAHAEQASAERTRQSAEQERLSALSADAIRDAHNDVAGAVGADVVAGVAMSAAIEDPAVTSAASRLAAARDRLANEEAVYQQHNGKTITLRNRIADKERVRDAILARRRDGDEQAGDAAEVALLAEDISSLKELAADAHRNAEQYRPGTARRMVQEAESALLKAKAQAVFNTKQARLLELEQAFLAAHADLVQAGSALGVNRFQAFKASNDLRMIAYGTISY